MKITVEDVGSTVGGAYDTALDGNSGGFRFNTIDPETYTGVSAWTGDVGAGEMLWEGAANPTGSFSTGFNFAGAPFVPYTFGSNANGDITANTLTISTLDFGGNYTAVPFDFNLPPDPGTLQVNWVVDGPTPAEKLVSFQWSHLITTADDPSGTYVGFEARWIIEGTATLAAAGPATTIEAAVLPSSRSVEVASPATAFATIINSGTGDATGCGIAPTTVVDAAFQYQTTDASNALTGSVNTPADILAGQQQNYVFAFTPNSAFAPTDVQLEFDCADTDPATVVSGLNTLLLSASDTPVADIVALAATLNSDGYTDIPGDTGTGVFAVAAVNVGSADTITASSTLSGALPVTVSLCETDAGGACLAAPTSTVTTSIANGATPSFAAFVTGSGTVADDPAANRITVQFEDAAMVVRGATSVAVRTVTP